MMLGKRSASDALLPTIDSRPNKRTSSTDDDNNVSVMTEDDSNRGGLGSWIFGLANTVISSFAALSQDPKAQEIVTHASQQIHRKLDTATHTLRDTLDGVLPTSLASKPPVPSAPSPRPVHAPVPALAIVPDSPAPSTSPSKLSLQASPFTASLFSPSPFSPAQKSWAPSPPSSPFKVPISPIKRQNASYTETWHDPSSSITTSPQHGSSGRSARRPLSSDQGSPNKDEPEAIIHSTPASRRAAAIPLFQSSQYRNGGNSLFASTSTSRSSVAYGSPAAGLLNGYQGLGVKAASRYEHIHMREHRQKQAQRTQMELDSLARQYEEKKAAGYGQDFNTFVNFEEYRARVASLGQDDLLGSDTVHKLSGLRHPPGSQHGNGASQYTPSMSSRKLSVASTSTGYSPPRMNDFSKGVSSSFHTGLDLGDIGLGRPPPSDLFKNSTASWPRGPSGGSRSRYGPISPTSLVSDLKPRGLVLSEAIKRAKAALQVPRPPVPDVPAFDRLSVKDKQTDEEITRRMKQMKKKKLPTRLPDAHLEIIKRQLHDRNFAAKVGKEQVTSKDIGRLCPAQWLNDEIINFWGAMLMERAEQCKVEAANSATTGGKGKGKAVDTEEEPGRFGFPEPLHNIHYFNTYFYAKLEQQGYEKARLGKWTKKVDIFSKDVVLIPINQGNAHWTSATINFKKKRFEFYDSLGLARPQVFLRLRDYVDKEHIDKKKTPFDFSGWEDFYDPEMPQQENGYDCGMFVCMVMEGLSRGEEVDDWVFDQTSMPYLRQRVAWEIGRQKLS
ncbi:Smt3-specific protease [Tulasnella sp. JGI-2019a]|nr:Smt3-specific protease [Tulasnella sp. JGI-2019a]